MTSKLKLKLLKGLNQLKEVVLDAIEFQHNLENLPTELVTRYETIYNEMYSNSVLREQLSFRPIFYSTLKDTLKVRVSISPELLSTDDWEQYLDHGIDVAQTNTDDIVYSPAINLDGEVVSNGKGFIKIDKIQLSNFRFFIDDEENNTFELDSKNMLLYGENGSGKSSLFKAFELLSKIGKQSISSEFASNKNIFTSEEDSFSFINFAFTNDISLQIDDDNHQKNSLDFIKNLSVFKPLLDYKELLKIVDVDKKNLYKFFENILAEYPISEKEVLKNLKEKEDERYFYIFENILTKELFDYINDFLEEFQQHFKLTEIKFSANFKKINFQIKYFDREIEDYQLFLNEARLSALAISVYFSIIKKQFSLLSENSLKILVLDDLLISLDMNNRLNLINILKSEFSDFQIFFFTHDKGFFEILKEKMPWKAYELYIDNEGEFEKPYIKKSLNYFESAKKYFDEYDYPACANYLRKEVERLKKIKEKQEMSINQDVKLFKKIKKMLLSSDLMSDSDRVRRQLIGFKQGLEEKNDSDIEIDLRNINSITNRILHPLSHDDNSKPLYKKELEDAIATISELRDRL